MFSTNPEVIKAYEDQVYTDVRGTEWQKGLDGWFDRSDPKMIHLMYHHTFVEMVENENPEGEKTPWEDFRVSQYEPERMEKMAPILDRIPERWGKYIPLPGWDKLLMDLDAKLSELDPDYIICQAKEKFGGLRFYTEKSDHFRETGSAEDSDYFDDLIHETEEMSYRICEGCGSRGKSRSGGWIKVLCDTHAEQSQKI